MLRPFVVGLTILLTSVSSWAQSISLPVDEIKKEAQPTTPTPDQTSALEKKDAERVEVTGSHIRRIDVEGPAPITTINRKDMEKTGYNSVADVMRDTSINSFGSARESSGNNAAGNAEISLRGLGSDNTLVLLDGQRLPTDAVTGAVDVSLIPMAAVERVEVLRDGASAIYGSDALGGVVNIITRKDFQGSQMSIMEVTPEQKGGRKTDLNLVNGFNRKNFNMVNVVQYRDNAEVYSQDRSWTDHRLSPSGNPGTYSSDGSATSHVVPNCPPDRIRHTGTGDQCMFNTSDYSTELPAVQQLSILSQSNITVNSNVKVTARLGGTQRHVQWQMAPPPGNVVVPWSQAQHDTLPAGTFMPGKDINVDYRLTGIGPRKSDVTTKGFNTMLNTNIKLSDDWSMDVTGAFNDVQSIDKGINGYALASVVQDQIDSGKCDPLNPDNQATCGLGAQYVPTERTRSLLSSGEVKASGPLKELPAGDLNLAVGSIFTYQSYQDNYDDQSTAGNVVGNAGSSGGGHREITAGYTELGVPITKKLELQLAGRFDHYSDVGNTVNPKGAILYRATDKVLLRSSVGTGFKAPLMSDLYAASADGYQDFIDKKLCDQERAAGGPADACNPQQHRVVSGGNTGLRPEKSVTYTGGAVVQPTRDLSFGSDLFMTKSKNVVGIDMDDVMTAESLYGQDYVAQHGVIIERDSTGKISKITAPLQNLSQREVTGIDLNASYRFRKFKLSSDHSQLFYYKEQGFPGVPYRNKLGEQGKPNWRNSTALTYNPGERHDITVVAQTIAGQRKLTPGTGSLRNFTTWDLEYAYNSKALGTFTAGIRNVLGETPPLDDSDSTTPLNTSLYDQVGRQVFTGYKATF